jgi:hypothetical protein
MRYWITIRRAAATAALLAAIGVPVAWGHGTAWEGPGSRRLGPSRH